MNTQFEHEDLEARITISAEVGFESNLEEFEGLNEVEFEIKKKVITQIPIQNVELRKPGSSKGGLF